ncbi:DivIVA domain-containing protein [Actinoplanes sp. NPDC020271]|uniref:DivIVA domain-containing protein n=1 Tax=Actinoplanes sp. NPDC020271 TaxID=3363896 RepID=UPI003788ABD3
MSLTPPDLNEVAFRRPPTGRPGYDENQVDDFLDALHHRFTELTAQNRELREQLHEAPEQEAAFLTAHLRQLRDEQAMAEQRARRLQLELDEARADVSGMVAMAQRTADNYLRDAEHTADALLTAARTKADQLTSEAAIKASTIESDARHRHAQAMSAITADRAAALQDIDRLESAARTLLTGMHEQARRRLQKLDPLA